MMKKVLPLLLSAVFLAACGAQPRAAAKPARVRPACERSAALLPGTGFDPALDAERTVAANELLAKIAACVELPFAEDHTVFGNREGRLPPRPRGYYLEYSFPVPGRGIGAVPVEVSVGTVSLVSGIITSPRGPERLVIGGGSEIYYTPDHYLHFVELKIKR
jgi:guanyl-specific ribonuclease Sa